MIILLRVVARLVSGGVVATGLGVAVPGVPPVSAEGGAAVATGVAASGAGGAMGDPVPGSLDGPGATTVGSLETGMEPAPDGTWETAAPGDALTEHATSTEAKTAARPSERVWITLHLRA
jgi:hypothetical protein